MDSHKLFNDYGVSHRTEGLKQVKLVQYGCSGAGDDCLSKMEECEHTAMSDRVRLVAHVQFYVSCCYPEKVRASPAMAASSSRIS